MNKHPASNYVLQARSNEFYWEGGGQLSVKTFRNGRARYKKGPGTYAVEEGRYLLLNEGDYALSIEEAHPVESFCVFFRDGFAGEVLQSLTADPDRLLSDPFRPACDEGFFERTYQPGAGLSGRLAGLQEAHLLSEDPAAYEEPFYPLMQEILLEQSYARREASAISAEKRSTREELYKRLMTANEYIRACYASPVTLDELSRIACLSPNHLLRSYTGFFGRTPHQHLAEFRIRKAKDMLEKEEWNMTDISFAVGFQTPSSFSKMFRKHTGLSPLQHRKKVRLDKNETGFSTMLEKKKS
ncbi:helix-turn-helix transcriptional regulator [Bacillus infantis]|uniref:Helix-turn-helix transcriptional regulator n=1 Tax=Bacillus infantis TaxID=324767 RepID=A0A5D4SQP4_9BACI|nr:AraC family transcriptional regulator [Bacillus infantis]TYS64136.1 helix-turn-helix transcriptional regulator [Bacillus infantis]